MMKDFVHRNKLPIFLCCIGLFILLGFLSVVHRCSNTEVLPHYGSSDYTFVMCTVGSGRSERFYAGTLSNKDYQKWLDGEPGTIFVHNARNPERGYRLNLSTITIINNWGRTPDWLPMNFVG